MNTLAKAEYPLNGFAVTITERNGPRRALSPRTSARDESCR